MSSQILTSDWTQLQAHILQLEQQGLVTRTFRRLDPPRQQAVLQAILDEAAGKGPANINIKEVARRAGVSIGSLYQYFGNRENLLAFAVELSVRMMTDLFAISRPYLLEMPLREALNAYVSYGLEWCQSQPGFIHFFGRAAYQGDPQMAEKVVRPVATAMRQVVQDILTAAAQRGELRPDLDVEAAARVVNLLTIAAGDSQLLPYLNNYFQVTDESMPVERVVNALVDLVMN
ncbi:MAG: TetR/AcrR family transcriptional regulator, partial [Anaerolineales bacterium]|nr:TetR/AcrR family transcriptional regulator [Anaerolineales bacterium]